MTKQKMTWADALAHVGDIFSSEIEARALAAIPHYIWMERDGKKLMGFCTNCLMWHEIDTTKVPDWVAKDPYMPNDIDDDPEFDCPTSFSSGNAVKGNQRHKRIGQCRRCGTKAMYRHLSMGYKTLHDRDFLITYKKSAIDKDAIVCVGYDIYVPWGEMDPYAGTLYPPMDIQPVEVCVFRYGKGGDRFIRKVSEGWHHFKECKSGYQPGQLMGLGTSRVRTILDRTSLQDAIAGTPFAWVLESRFAINASTAWDFYDKISVFAKVAKYPCIEYLFKLGFDELANYALYNAAGQLINLRGKTAKAVLRLTDQQWGEVKGNRVRVTRGMLEAVQYAKQHRLRWNMELCAWLGGSEIGTIEEIRTEFKALDITAVVKYCRRKAVPLRDYLDYLSQLRQLRENMASREMLYPANFNEMHTRLSARIEVKANKGLAKKIRDLLPKLSEYCFSAYGLVLRPMVGVKEIIREGTQLHHCVGGYVNAYAEGRSVLCCLRDETALYTPLYTVEFGKEGRLIQCRGERNQTNPKDKERLTQFWKLFEIMRADLRTQNARDPKQKKKERVA